MNSIVESDVFEGVVILDGLVDSISSVYRGKRETVQLVVASFLAGGHVLLEDVPGTGKTTLARSVAASLGLTFRRIQFTSDMLPSDVVGVSVFNPQDREWEVRRGPIFSSVVLADEINRAPPRTQSGLLQAMEEGAVTIDQATYRLPDLFFVLATQNPIEQHGTYPLPESQMDRFLIRCKLGFPARDQEVGILRGLSDGTLAVENLRYVSTEEDLIVLRSSVDRVHVEDALVQYLLDIVEKTRNDPRFYGGVSTRASVGLFRLARAWALIQGRNYLLPEDISRMVVPCLSHRLIARVYQSEMPDVEHVLREIVESISVPV
jgi:MoxR-like ATPase